MQLASNGKLADLWRYTYGDGAKWNPYEERWIFKDVELPERAEITVVGLLIATALLPFTWISFSDHARNIFERLGKSVASWLVLSAAAGLISNAWIWIPLFNLKYVGSGILAGIASTLLLMITGDIYQGNKHELMKALRKHNPIPKNWMKLVRSEYKIKWLEREEILSQIEWDHFMLGRKFN